MRAMNSKFQNGIKGLLGTFGAFALLYLAGCGGGGTSGIRDSDLDALRSDPRIVRLTGIVERADTLLIPSLHLNYRLTAQGQTESDRLAVNMRCSGTRCVGSDGTVVTLDDLISPSEDTYLQEVSLGSRGGFDTVTAKSGFEVGGNIEGITFSDIPSATEHGLWGQYGYAAAAILSGSVSGRFEGVAFQGDIGFATAYATGDASGTNPAGLGSATWRGIAEAASTRTFELRQGTAVVTIEDLSRPRVNVDIDVEGYSIGSSAWTDMALTEGRYGSGAHGRDYLSGGFYGPDHVETYGVFDTGAYVGAYGAKREQ